MFQPPAVKFVPKSQVPAYRAETKHKTHAAMMVCEFADKRRQPDSPSSSAIEDVINYFVLDSEEPCRVEGFVAGAEKN